MLLAEDYRSRKRYLEAAQYYDLSIACAKEHKHIGICAIANERAAEYYLSFNHNKSAGIYCQEAKYYFRKWGLNCKLHQLDQEYGYLSKALNELISQGKDTAKSSDSYLGKDSSLVTTSKQALDYASLIKSSQALSSEKTLKGLVTTLMHTLMENIGASRGLLFLLRNESSELYCEAEIDNINQTEKIFSSSPLNDTSPCLVTMIRFAMRTMEVTVLNDDNLFQFATGDYYRQIQPKSVICSPIISGGRLLGIIYLENRLVEGTFTEDRLKITKIISAQAAVSLENIKLYENLEYKVMVRTRELAERTNDIKKILQNLKQGIFTITKDLKIHPEYSSYLHTIFATEEIAHLDATHFLLGRSTLDADTISKIKNSLITMIGDEIINFEINQHLLPKEVILLPDKKTLEVDWEPITNKEQTVEKMLVIIKDVSELRNIRGKAKAKETELNVIGELLNNKPESLAFFFQNSKELLSECKQKLETPQMTREDINIIFRNIHTIKGNSRVFSLSLISEAAHIAESFIRDINTLSPSSFALQNLSSELNDIEVNLGVYESLFKNKLQGFNHAKSPELTLLLQAEKVLYNRTPFEKNDNSLNACRELSDLFRQRSLISLHQILDDLIESLPELAVELKKPAPYLDIEHGHVPLNISQITMLKDVFMHCIRNSLDHGIEPPTERIKKQKSPVGKIRINYKQDDKQIRFFIRDDGKGLNLMSIREKAISDGLITAQADEESIAGLIFNPGFSMAGEVTQISGRGYGMEAIRGFLANIGGTADIKFIEGNCDFGFRAFELVLTVPIQKSQLSTQVA